LAEAVSAWKPDVLHLNSSKAGVIGTGVLRPPRGVTIFTCHHAPFGPGRQWTHRLVARPVEQVVLPRLDGIISDGVRDIPILRRIAPSVPLKHIANAVPASGSPASTEPVRPHALWVARMAAPKDPVLAVRVWEHVCAKIPEARLVMCGTGPLSATVKRAIESSPARHAVDFKGFVEDLRPLRADASLYLLCTRVEGGLTMATLEAMSEGLVPVVTDAGDAPQLERDQCGVCATGRDPESIARRIVELLSDAPRFDELRRNAVHYATVERTPAHLVAETEAFYEEVTGVSARR
jgi:glycosyltransferase involved in cell wall biosynthesis